MSERPGIWPAAMKRKTAAAYLDLTPDGFDSWVRAGIIPGPIVKREQAGDKVRKTRRWHREAIDAALNKHSGIEQYAPDPLREWELEHESDA